MSVNNRRLEHTQRDEELYTSLYAATMLTAEQIAEAHFPSVHSAEVRLYKLRGVGRVKNELVDLGKGLGKARIWYLSPKLFYREAKAAERLEEEYLKLPKKMAHYLRTNDLYADIYRGLQKAFEDTVGWRWNNESHASCHYEYAGKSHAHQPDAEVVFPDGRVFFIERQTRESKETRRVFQDKAASYRNYMNYRNLAQNEAKVIFACDLDRDMDHAYGAFEEADVPCLTTSAKDAATYLKEQARKHEQGQLESAQAEV